MEEFWDSSDLNNMWRSTATLFEVTDQAADMPRNSPTTEAHNKILKPIIQILNVLYFDLIKICPDIL